MFKTYCVQKLVSAMNRRQVTKSLNNIGKTLLLNVKY